MYFHHVLSVRHPMLNHNNDHLFLFPFFTCFQSIMLLILCCGILVICHMLFRTAQESYFLLPKRPLRLLFRYGLHLTSSLSFTSCLKTCIFNDLMHKPPCYEKANMACNKFVSPSMPLVASFIHNKLFFWQRVSSQNIFS